MLDTDELVTTYLDAKALACDWHGGQTSALYAFCSSGTLDLDACIREAERADAYSLADMLEELDATPVTVTVYRTRFDPDGIVDGEYGPDAVTDTEVTTYDTIREAASAIEGEGCGGNYGYSSHPMEWYAGGWYTMVDGSETVDYYTGEREERSCHVSGTPDWAARLVHTIVCPPRTSGEVDAARMIEL